MVRRYRCDKPMAHKKGLLKFCDRKCNRCVAGLAYGRGYIEGHVPLQDEREFSDPKLMARNMLILSGRRPK